MVLLRELLSSVTFVLFGSAPYILMCGGDWRNFLLLTAIQCIGRFIVFTSVVWGGHPRDTASYTEEPLWAIQQILNTNNVVKPAIFGVWQKAFALDFPWMVEHHLFPHISTTTYGGLIRKEIKVYCTEHGVKLNDVSIFDTWRWLMRWSMSNVTPSHLHRYAIPGF